MEENSDIALLKGLYKDYTFTVSTSFGLPKGQVAIGGFISILAVKMDDIETPAFTETWFRGNGSRKLIYEFKHKYLSQIGHPIEDIYSIPFDEHILFYFLERVSSLNFDINIKLFEILEEMLEDQSTHLSVYDTPIGLGHLLALASDIKKGDSVFDPAIGSGGLMNELNQSKLQGVEIIGAESIVRNQILTRLKTILLGSSTVEIFRGSAADYNREYRKPKFDVVISNPPVGKISRNEVLREFEGLIPYVSTDRSMNLIEVGLQNLKPNGRAAFLVNMGVLFSLGDSRNIRESWLQRKILRSVVSLPAGLLRHTSNKCVLLIFGSTELDGHDNDSVRFVKAEDCFTKGKRRKLELRESDVKEILSRVKYGTDDSNHIDVSFRKIAENEFNLDPASYFAQHELVANRSLASRWVRIDEVADVFSGTRLSSMPKGNQAIVQGRDIRVEVIDKEKLHKKDLSTLSKKIQKTIKNDVLLQRIGSSPAAYLIQESEENLVVSDTLFLIRFRELPKDTIDFIVHYINSDLVSGRLSNARSYSVVQTQNLKTVRSLEVPLPDADVINTLKKLNLLETRLKKEYEQTAVLKEALFRGDDSTDLLNQIERARLTVDTLNSAINKKDEISYLIAEKYPFPLAYSYRNIYAERDLASIYERQMKYGEQFLAFLVALGMSLVAKFSDKVSDKDLLKETVDSFSEYLDSGISPGHWQETLQKCCKLLRDVKDEKLCIDFSEVWFKSRGKKLSSFATNTKNNLVSPLNDFKHHRGPNNKHERKKSIEQQKAALEELLNDVNFLIDWDLILIEEMDRNWLTHQYEFEASLLKGDHPAHQPIKFQFKNTLPKNKLYVQSEDECISLYPMLSLVYNEQTKREEVFGFDKRLKEGVSLRSFESGTSIQNKAVAKDFDHWVKKTLSFWNFT